jgi:hypothetical protein
MTADELAEHVAEVGRHRQVAPFEQLLGLQAGPLAYKRAPRTRTACRYRC